MSAPSYTERFNERLQELIRDSSSLEKHALLSRIAFLELRGEDSDALLRSSLPHVELAYVDLHARGNREEYVKLAETLALMHRHLNVYLLRDSAK
jgi:hypothetical protein